MSRFRVVDGGGQPPAEAPVEPNFLQARMDELARRRMSVESRQEQLQLAIQHLCSRVAWCDVMNVESLQGLRWSASEFHALLHSLERDLVQHEAGGE